MRRVDSVLASRATCGSTAATIGFGVALGAGTECPHAGSAPTAARTPAAIRAARVTNADVAHADWCVALFQKNSRYNQTLWGATIAR